MRAERLQVFSFKVVHYVGPSMEMVKVFLWLNQKEEYDCKDFRLNSY